MASKRHLRRKSCEGKMAFNDFFSAARHAVYRAHQSGDYLLAYRCRFCRKFHIGHPPRRVLQAIAARRTLEGAG